MNCARLQSREELLDMHQEIRHNLRRQHGLALEDAERAVVACHQRKHLDCARPGIGNPVFLHACLGVYLVLSRAVMSYCAGRRDLDNKVGRANNARLCYSVQVWIQHHHHIGLYDSAEAKLNIEWGNEDLPDARQFHMSPQVRKNFTDSILVISTRRW